MDTQFVTRRPSSVLTPMAHTRHLARALLLVPLVSVTLTAQGAAAPDTARRPASVPPVAAPAKPWYEKLSVRGYVQFRYNRLFETNPDLTCAQCDKSIGNAGGFFLRRGRVILSGNVHPRVSVYLQPDYGADVSGTLHFFQLRDAYADVALDGARVHRVRIGQSKIPFGFENLQSSSNRLPLDRHDAMNSGVPNERDIGVLYYWTSPTAAGRFKVLVDSGLKGSGDYGVFGVGLYNGQTANRPEANNSSHAVARLTYPWRLASGQYLEASVQGYTGRFVLPTVSSGVGSQPEYLDQRQAVSVVWYAQPFGVVAEYNTGRGPQYVAASNRVEERPLSGGYLQAMYRYRTRGQVIQPFVRVQEYHGGKKAELDARHYEVHEQEVGVEWLPNPSFELTVQYTASDRLFEDSKTIGNRQSGRFLRVQAQINY